LGFKRLADDAEVVMIDLFIFHLFLPRCEVNVVFSRAGRSHNI
jgi:hypothetical protein